MPDKAAIIALSHVNYFVIECKCGLFPTDVRIRKGLLIYREYIQWTFIKLTRVCWNSFGFQMNLIWVPIDANHLPLERNLKVFLFSIINEFIRGTAKQ